MLPTVLLRAAAKVTGFTAHRPLVQVPLAQSAPAPQSLPTAHFGQVLPPQSTSDSAPSLIMLLHETGTRQTLLEQKALAQSLAIKHICPFAHLLGQMPPQ